MKQSIFILILAILSACNTHNVKEIIVNGNFVLLSGEITSNSVILQCRLAKSDSLINYDIPGHEGIACFQVSQDSLFKNIIETNWLEGNSNNDFIVKSKIEGLLPSTKYFYRVKGVINEQPDTQYSRIGLLKTLPDRNDVEEVSFVMSTGFNYEKFYGKESKSGRSNMKPAAVGIDRKLGFEAFETVKNLKINFFIANGDVVYYDKPSKEKHLWARTKEQMRAKWHRYFAMPRNQEMCLQTPVYYLKDDHDHRFNDCDTTNEKYSEPSNQLGIEIFKEQVPIVDPQSSIAKTYRTHRVGKHLQLWFVEGRDYRSPNSMEDTPKKTIWGKEQLEWLKSTLLKSDATFKILVSPTPMIGPDDAYKTDNHTNINGFQSEGKAFFEWLIKNGFLEKNFYFTCGDRHWQYHSVHPSGFEEFSSGAFVDQNSRPGRIPGDPKSTDPNAIIKVPYIQFDEWGGGFLFVKTYLKNEVPTIKFSFHDIKGKESYAIEKKINSN